MNTDIQKLTMREITKASNCNMPEKDKVLTVHDLNLSISLFNKGSYSKILSFLDIRGTPRYLIRREPIRNP